MGTPPNVIHEGSTTTTYLGTPPPSRGSPRERVRCREGERLVDVAVVATRRSVPREGPKRRMVWVAAGGVAPVPRRLRREGDLDLVTRPLVAVDTGAVTGRRTARAPGRAVDVAEGPLRRV